MKKRTNSQVKLNQYPTRAKGQKENQVRLCDLEYVITAGTSSEARAANYSQHLPDEVLGLILGRAQNFNARTHSNIYLTCKKWRTIASENFLDAYKGLAGLDLSFPLKNCLTTKDYNVLTEHLGTDLSNTTLVDLSKKHKIAIDLVEFRFVKKLENDDQMFKVKIDVRWNQQTESPSVNIEITVYVYMHRVHRALFINIIKKIIKSCPSIECLKLNSVLRGGKRLHEIMNALNKWNTSMDYLSLNSCSLSDSDMEIINSYLEDILYQDQKRYNQKPFFLNFNDNKITDQGIDVLYSSLETLSSYGLLEGINLKNNDISQSMQNEISNLNTNFTKIEYYAALPGFRF